MGAIGGVAWVSRKTEWPVLDKTDTEYVADLTNTLEAPVKLAHGHGHGGDDAATKMDGMDMGAPIDAAEAADDEQGGHGEHMSPATEKAETSSEHEHSSS